MLLSPARIAGTLTSLGETEASSAGEQLAKGYPSRAVTDLRRGVGFRASPPPSANRYCPPMPQKTPAEEHERAATVCALRCETQRE
jgi:hypothetical protein